jgi:hypothetical protein
MDKPNKSKIASFKKFSELNKSGKISEEKDSVSKMQLGEDKLPMNPNLPIESTKKPVRANTKYLKPRHGEELDLTIPEDSSLDIEDDVLGEEEVVDIETDTNTEDVKENKKVEFIGKVAKLPKGVKAANGFNFLESIKISKSSIWYLMVERQDNELQMVKYNHKQGVDLNKFITGLKKYYSEKYSSNPQVLEKIKNIVVDGNDKFSMVKNIPTIELEGKKMISRITEDLIKLLSK